MTFLLPVIALLGLPLLLLILGRRYTQKHPAESKLPQRRLVITRWAGWICCTLPIVRVALIRVEDHYGGPGSPVNVALLIATIAVGVIAMSMFILNAPERERSFGALACIIAVLGSVAIFLAGLIFNVVGRTD